MQHILGGLLTLESDWTPPLGDALTSALTKAGGDDRLDLGCVAAHGMFGCDADGCHIVSPIEKPATAFLLELIARLQENATVPMIDVRAYARWLPAATGNMIKAVTSQNIASISPAKNGPKSSAFEVEHSTSIYSGIVRMLDLALSGGDLQATAKLFLVAPDAREADVRAQLQRPAFRRVVDLDFSYLPYGELDKNREAIGRFGSGLRAIVAIARKLT